MDVGGTFTDLVCGDNEGSIHFEKTVTNRKDQAQGVLRGLSKLANRAGHDLAKFLDSVICAVMVRLLEEQGVHHRM